MTARAPDTGFTLVEMLVSLAITGMAAVLMSTGIDRIARTLGHSAQTDRQLDETATAQFVLRHRLERTFPARDRQSLNTVAFVGQDASLDFVAPAPDRGGPDALHNYRLKLARDGTLTLYHLSSLTTAVDLKDPAVAGWQATPLLRGATGIAIAYFGPRANASGQAWQSSWVGRLTLPLLVRVRVDLAATNARGWPELVVHPRVANGDACERDLLTDQCKGAT